MNNRFAAKYEVDELNDIADLLEDSYDHLPFSLTEPLKNYEDCLEKQDLSGAFRCLLDFFEMAIQFQSGLIISWLSHQEVSFDEELKAVMEKIVEKPLSFGDWITSIFLVLVKKAAVLLPGNELVIRLHQGLVKERKGNILEGWNKTGEEFKSLASFRNKWAHDTFRSAEINLHDLVILEPRMWEFLKMLQPLAEYQFFMLEQIIETEADEKPYTIIRDPSPRAEEGFRITSDILLDEHAYYVTDQKIRRRALLEGKTIVKLSPFIINYYNQEVNLDQKFQYIFQTLNEKNLKKMNYISASKQARRMETELFKDHFWNLLETVFGRFIQQDKYKVRINKEKTLGEYSERVQAETNSFLNQQINSDKYDPNVFLAREYLTASYEDFLRSDQSAYIMLGDAGSGKTNQICHWASELRPGCLVLAYYSKNFARNTLEKQLTETFKEPKKTAEQILSALESTLEKADMMLCLFFDAINECNAYANGEPGNGPVELLTEINTVFVKGNFKRIKLVISCRSYTWEELLNKDILQLDRYYTVADSNEDHVTLTGFSDEEFNAVYPKYAAKYEVHTPLEKLLEDRFEFVRRRLFDPLILKTAAQNFRGREFPNDLRQFNSTNLFRERVASLVKNENGEEQRKFLNDFTALLWADFSDAIPLYRLQSAFEDTNSPLHRLALNTFKDDSYRYKIGFINLLEEGILRIEKGTKREIRFVYERFNEYLFANHFIFTESTGAYQKDLIPASAYEKVLRSSGHSTVIIAALRNALIIEFDEKHKDPGTIIELSLSSLYEAQPLVEETLGVLINESYLDVLDILTKMLDYGKDESRELIRQRDELDALLTKGKQRARLSDEAQHKTVLRKQEISDKLLNIMKVRKIAISVIYKIFKSDRADILINDEKTDPNRLLWIAMADPLPEVRDNASIYIYYVARYNTATGMRIIKALSDKVLHTPVTALLKSSSRRELQQSYIEPACRVGLFLVIDGLIERADYPLAIDIQNTWKQVVAKFTLNHTLIKLVMPFFKILLARQTVVQAEYVNNGIEYRHFWDTYPQSAPYPEWSLESYRKMVRYLDPASEGFSQHEAVFYNGYLTGDSYSLFLLERILIVQGLANWNNINSIVQRLSHLSNTEQAKNYIEMSVIYALYQINLKSDKIIPAAERLFSTMVENWSVRQKGFYFAHYNEKANGGKPYKQFVLNWYAAAYCRNYGDGGMKDGDEHSAPVIRNLIELAFRKRDKALLYNCIENIAMIVPTSGYYKTALQLFEYMISLFRNASEIREFDRITLEGKLFEKGLRSFICDMLGTVKSYYPKEVDHFIVNKLKASQFPDLEAFREEIFNHSVSHEGIGDLLTHKFGNFVIWGILNDKDIRKFFIEICNFGPDCKSYIEWFDNSIRHCFQEVLGVKNLSN